MLCEKETLAMAKKNIELIEYILFLYVHCTTAVLALVQKLMRTMDRTAHAPELIKPQILTPPHAQA